MVLPQSSLVRGAEIGGESASQSFGDSQTFAEERKTRDICGQVKACAANFIYGGENLGEVGKAKQAVLLMIQQQNFEKLAENVCDSVWGNTHCVGTVVYFINSFFHEGDYSVDKLERLKEALHCLFT